MASKTPWLYLKAKSRDWKVLRLCLNLSVLLAIALIAGLVVLYIWLHEKEIIKALTKIAEYFRASD